jgi:hypothetical protein
MASYEALAFTTSPNPFGSQTLRMYIPGGGTKAGNVGIGTISPTAKLHLEGDAIIEGVLRADNVNLGLGGAIKVKASNTASDQYVAFGTTPSGSSGNATFTEKMRITSAGNVGIGTATPNTYSNQTTLTINGSTYGRIDLESGGTLRSSLFSQAANTSLTVDTGFFSLDTGGSERMRITSTGNVGIGTTLPGTINSVAFSGVGLHVKSGTLGRTITEGSNEASYLLNNSGASANQRIKYIQSTSGNLAIGSFDDNGLARPQITVLNSGSFGS